MSLQSGTAQRAELEIKNSNDIWHQIKESCVKHGVCLTRMTVWMDGGQRLNQQHLVIDCSNILCIFLEKAFF